MRVAAIVCVLIITAGEGFALEGGKQLTLNLDYFDVAIGTDCWDLNDNAGEMDRIIAIAAHYGVDRILFRVSICGVVAYHSKIMYTADDKAFEAYVGRELLDGGVGNIPSYIPRMARVMEDIDPLAECIKACRKYGIEVWAWVTVFDSHYYAPPEEFFQAHPEYTWVSRDGTEHISGVPCYAYPEVREYRLDQMRELLEYKPDGIYLSMRSHSSWPYRGKHSGVAEDCGSRGFGYNQPVVEEYRRRYGKDPREVPWDSLDAIRFVKLKGEFFKTWLAQVHELTQAAGVGLAMNTQVHSADPISANWMYIPADDIAREHVVDELSILAGAGQDMNHWRVLAGNDIRMTTFTSIHNREWAKSRAAWRRGLREMLLNPTSDGACFHEFANVYYFNMWHDIADVLGEVRAAG
ncbi:MAG: hypothetical protein J7M38_01005 [Armatimonadetes bacterium]|nr:hypothetical protein [Armatimonadota bacterium]